MDNSTTQSEPLFVSQFTPKIPTVEQEFERVWYVMTARDFFEKYGYKVVIPEHSYFSELWSRPLNEVAEQKSTAERIFSHEIYDPMFYAPAVSMVEQCNEALAHSGPVLAEMHRLWGFRLFPIYTVLLTRYGTNGSYFSDTGTIQIRYNADGQMGRIDPVSTLMHEVVHCGIEDEVVLKYQLSHSEKERLVDLLMQLCLQPFLPTPYTLQPLGDAAIDAWITAGTINDLPKAIAGFVAEHPRVSPQTS